MAVHVQTKTASGGTAWEDVDLAAVGFGRLTFSISYSHPATMEFTLIAPQQSQLIGHRVPIRMWDDSLAVYNSSSSPVFSGHVFDIIPGTKSNEVNYICMDPTQRVSDMVTVFNAPWTDGTTPGTNAYPRAVYNCPDDKDDDHTYSILLQATLGEIMEDLFDNHLLPLREHLAAPAASDAYDGTELAAFVQIPQSKLVMESESFRRAIQRLLDLEAKYKLLYQPEDMKWHFVDITAAPQYTLYLNQSVTESVVLSMNISRSLEGRVTAIKYYGPEALTRVEAKLSDSSLTALTDDDFDEICPDLTSITLYRHFQITDTAKRHMARHLLEFETVQISDLQAIALNVPYLQMQKESGGPWFLVPEVVYDTRTGEIWAPTYVGTYREEPPTTNDCNWAEPFDIRFVYCHFDTPLSVRYPSSGFEGTAYTVYGIENELAVYDDMLAIGYENFNPVTSVDRLDAFEKLAQARLEGLKDVVHAGGCTIEGLIEAFMRLNKRININAIDADGDPLTTGWESANMYLTDAEFDWEQQLTTLTFSSDQLEMIGQDPDQLRRTLKIRALQQGRQLDFRIYRNKFGQITMEFTSRTYYTDEQGNEVTT